MFVLPDANVCIEQAYFLFVLLFFLFIIHGTFIRRKDKYQYILGNYANTIIQHQRKISVLS